MSHVDQGSSGQPEQPDQGALVAVAPAALRPTYPVGELLGRPVRNEIGEQIGHIDDLMVEHDRLAYAILSVGGFLGVGSHQVAAPFDCLAIDDDAVVLPGATREALKHLSAYSCEQARTERNPIRKARKGVKDAGHIVSTAAGEPISGIIADITDADRR